MRTLFVTGIGTDVGKTVAAAILVESLKADYFKPIQAGDLDNSDTHKVKELVSNEKTVFHKNSYALKTPMSPHASAELDAIEIEISKIKRPKTKNLLIIEGAGGLLVPINNSQTIVDLANPKDLVIVVSRHYLGSINHTLLTLNYLKERGFDVALIFNGNKHNSTEDIILKTFDVPVIGRIEDEPYFDKNVIKEYAEQWEDRLKQMI